MMRGVAKRGLTLPYVLILRWLLPLAVAATGVLRTAPANAATPATAGVFVPHALTTHLKNHAATLLDDGTLLITGGQDQAGAAQSAAFIFDPATGTTTLLAAAMTTPRYNHTTTLLSDGRVLIAGGYTTGGAGPVASAELYSPTAHTFTAIGSTMDVGRAMHTATALTDGTVLLAGGWCGGGNCTTGGGGNAASGITLTADIYDPSTQTFYQVGNLRTTVVNQTATRLLDGTVLITGGISGGTPGAAVTPTPISRAQLYNPGSQSFGNIGGGGGVNLTIARASHQATLLNDGTVLITGGASYNGDAGDTLYAIPSAEIYNPGPRTFTLVPTTMNAPRVNHQQALLLDGEVIVAGGQDDTLTPLASAEVYDPVAKIFTETGASMDAARSLFTATPLVDGTVYFVGGATAATDGVQTDLFDGTPGSFVPTGSMTEPRRFHTATMLPDARVFLSGGQNALLGPLNSTEIYDGASFSAGPDLNVARSLHTATMFFNGAGLTTPQILISGGVTSMAQGWVTNTAEVYTPVAGGAGSAPVTTTTAMTNAPSGRFGHTATYLAPVAVPTTAPVLPNGGVLVVGGEDATGAVLATTDLFVPDGASNGSFNVSVLRTGKSSATAHNLKTARVYHTATTLCDGTVLVAGGRDPNGNYLNSVEVYDPTKDTFSTAGSGKTGGMLTARAFHTATLLSDCSVLFTGGVNSKGWVSAAERYVPPVTSGKTKTGGAFVAAPMMSIGRGQQTATFLPDGTVLIAGGSTGPTGVADTGEIYNPFLQTFTPAVGTMMSARFGQTATLLNSGFVLLAGGDDDTFATTAGSELYDPAAGPQSGGAIVAGAAQSKIGAANHVTKAGVVRITNMSNLPETVSGATLLLSNPTVFSSISLSGGGASAVASPSASNVLVFASPVTIAPGDTLKLSFAGTLAPHRHHQKSAQAVTGLSISNDLGQAASLGLPAAIGSIKEK